MADPSKTEKPTSKRKQEARERGQVARSQDIGGTAVLMAIIIMLHIGFITTLQSSAQSFAISFTNIDYFNNPTIYSAWALFGHSFLPYLPILGMAFAGAMAIGIAVNIAQFGLLFSPKLLTPNLKKLNPLTGFQRIFLSTQTLINLSKQLVKMAIILIICWLDVKNYFTVFYSLGHAAPIYIVTSVESIVYNIGIKVTSFLLILAIADYFWEKHRLEESLKMTKQEVKDEHKQQEGNAEIRGAVRQRQRNAARGRMMAAVPKATVIVTNPTHFAVALYWDDIQMDAPIVVAKGADLIAKKIREIALENNIPLMENPPLARALFSQIEIDQAITPDLYSAVANVIAFVYKLKGKKIV